MLVAASQIALLCDSQDQEGKPQRATVHDSKDGTYAVTYIPDKTGRYMIGVTYGGDNIPLSPYRIRATQTGDASKCLATGECRRASGLGVRVLASCHLIDV